MQLFAFYHKSEKLKKQAQLFLIELIPLILNAVSK